MYKYTNILYLIYNWHGQIKVKECVRDCFGNFRPLNKQSIWYTKIPSRPMKLEHGKVYCLDVNQIDDCIKMLKNHYVDRKSSLYHSINVADDIIGEVI